MSDVLMGRDLEIWPGATLLEKYPGEDFVHSIVEKVGWNIEDPLLDYAPGIGHLILNSDEGRFALGFSAIPKDGNYDKHGQTSTWDVNAMASGVHERPVDTADKGTGLRVYTTLEAAMGFTHISKGIGVIAVKIEDTTKILDTREDSDATVAGKAARIARHGVNMALSMLPGGTEAIIKKVNQSYGDADLVLISQPPRAALRQETRHAPNKPHTKPGWMLVRDNPTKPVVVTRIGTAHHYAEFRK